MYTFGYAGSQNCGLRLNHTTDFPGSPICEEQSVGLLSLHKCMYEPIRITKIILPPTVSYTYPLFSQPPTHFTSLEKLNTQVNTLILWEASFLLVGRSLPLNLPTILTKVGSSTLIFLSQS